MRAAILTIGDELIGGFSIDTNSSWIAQELLRKGVSVDRVVTVGDNPETLTDLVSSLDGAFDIVITTGGLGPTKDDLTKNVFCEYFDSVLIFDEEYWDSLSDRFAARGLKISPSNRSQAEIPDKATVLANRVGSALGLVFDSGQTKFYVLPGVPREMKAIMGDSILPTFSHLAARAWKTIRTTGIVESILAERIEPLLADITNLKIAYLPSYTGVDVRLMSELSGAAGEEIIVAATAIVETDLEQIIFGYGDTTLPQVVVEMLVKRGSSLAIAESCSGGLLSSNITDVPGCSEVFRGSIVAYANAVKLNHLKVDEKTLTKYGAVSEQVAREMAAGIRDALGTEWGVATTGISGPSGGSDEKPVGLVYIAVAGPKRTTSIERKLVPHRLAHKGATAHAALNLLRMEILNHG